ncbi:unnamed protein product [Clavelina lepadiformis]|uniref:BED-type domain-containing protein n=1 Tax=Clavelina lepadiformis TaxID=159417 RepID=A0ABP0G4H8_CLALP
MADCFEVDNSGDGPTTPSTRRNILHSSCGPSTSATPNDGSTRVRDESALNPWPHLKKFWKFLGYKGPNMLEFRCCLCQNSLKKISANRKSNFNLKRHILNVHPNKAKEHQNCIDAASKLSCKRRSSVSKSTSVEKKAKPKKLNEFLCFTQEVEKDKKISQETYEKKVMAVFIENMLPLKMVDSSSFQDLLKSFVPIKNPISRHSLTTCIEEKYSSSKQLLREILNEVPYVATTADLWSCRNKSYIGMTCHWIDKCTFERKYSVLACRQIKGRLTYDTLAKEMDAIYFDYQIGNKVVKTTTDNGSNFTRSFKVFAISNPEQGKKSYFTKEEEDYDDDEDFVNMQEILPIIEEAQESECYVLPKHIRCAGHTLNLVGTVDTENVFCQPGAFKSIYKNAFEKAEELWNSQSSSTKAAALIKDEIGGLLEVPNVTSWKSVLGSVEKLLEIFRDRNHLNGLNRVCSSLKVSRIDTDDINFFQEYYRVMKPLSQVLDIIQCASKAYLGVLLPSLAMTLKHLKDLRESGSIEVCMELLDAVIRGIQTRFSAQFEDIDCILASATHPQFKLAWLSCLEGFNYNVELMERKAKYGIISFLEAKSTYHCSSVNDDLSDNFFAALYAEDGEESIAMIVQNYLQLGPVPKQTISEEDFPNEQFADLFIKLNTAIPSTAAIDGMLSLGKDILQSQGLGLSDKHFEMFVFLKEFH